MYMLNGWIVNRLTFMMSHEKRFVPYRLAIQSMSNIYGANYRRWPMWNWPNCVGGCVPFCLSRSLSLSLFWYASLITVINVYILNGIRQFRFSIELFYCPFRCCCFICVDLLFGWLLMTLSMSQQVIYDLCNGFRIPYKHDVTAMEWDIKLNMTRLIESCHQMKKTLIRTR